MLACLISYGTALGSDGQHRHTHFGNAIKLELWINLIDTWGYNIDFS